MGMVADLADRVVVMYQGDVVEEAPARVLFAEPKKDYTKKLLAAVPTWAGTRPQRACLRRRSLRAGGGVGFRKDHHRAGHRGAQPDHRRSLEVLGYEMLNFRERTFRPLRRDIGFVFQDPAASFNPQLTIGDCVAEPMIIHTKPSPAQARKRVGDLLESVQLPAS